MTADMLRLHTRCKALALAAMASADGSPIGVASVTTPPPAKPGGSAAGQERGRCRNGPGLTAREVELLARMPPAVASRLAATLKRMGPPLDSPRRVPSGVDRSAAKRPAGAKLG